MRRAQNLSRGLVTTLLMIALAVLIVRDIVARRFGSTAPPAPDVTSAPGKIAKSAHAPAR
jgi:hypothetical protein